MDNKKILEVAIEQLAFDFNCTSEDFCSKENKVVISGENVKAKKYYPRLPFFCALASFGNNVVASVNIDIKEFIYEYINKHKIEDCFAPPNLFTLNDELRKHGSWVTFSAQRFLPDIEIIKPIPCEYEVKILQPDDYSHLYNIPAWNNAIGSGKRKHLNRLAVGAFDGLDLIGLAGSEACCESMFQIGVDVLPEYRRKGIAASLTSRLALEILHIGKVPFTGNVWANIPSFKTQFASGFKPAWVEMTASLADTDK
jgi:GNAT superfamily N-acetyltransferase